MIQTELLAKGAAHPGVLGCRAGTGDPSTGAPLVSGKWEDALCNGSTEG